MESTGAQIIDTGIVKPAIAKYRIRFVRTNVLQLMGFNRAYNKWGVNDKGKYRNSTNVTAFEAGGVDFITYNNLQYPTVLFSCNGDVESFVAENSYADGRWSIFAQNDNTYNCYARLYENSYAAKNGTLLGEFIPVIDALGRPCMFDKVSKQPFQNSGSGQFIVGMTLAQARKLGILPAGTTLKVSLPVGWQEDTWVANAIAKATAKGCILEQAEDWSEGDTTAASSYALRRIWVRRTPDANGSYVDAANTRWLVEWCVDVIGADPESLGYERFRSVDAAVAYWGLTPYVYPETETIES